MRMLPSSNRIRAISNLNDDAEKDCVKAFSNEESFNSWLDDERNQIRWNNYSNRVLKKSLDVCDIVYNLEYKEKISCKL